MLIFAHARPTTQKGFHCNLSALRTNSSNQTETAAFKVPVVHTMPRISAEEDEEFADFEARVADVGKFSDAPLRARASCDGHVRDAPPLSVSRHTALAAAQLNVC